MKTTAIITPEYQINLPSELQKQLKPGDEYNIVVTENSLILEKIVKPKIDVEGFLDELENLEPDLSQPSLEEISAVVQEVRRELWAK